MHNISPANHYLAKITANDLRRAATEVYITSQRLANHLTPTIHNDPPQPATAPTLLADVDEIGQLAADIAVAVTALLQRIEQA